MNIKAFTLEGFVPNGFAPVLSSVPVVKRDDGMLYKDEASKWTKVVDLNSLPSKYDHYLINKLAPEDVASGEHDTYFIFSTKPEGRVNGTRSPVAKLMVSKAGAPINEETGKPELEDICTLFIHQYDDGSSKLQGTDRDGLIRYGIFLNEAKQAEAIAVNQ